MKHLFVILFICSVIFTSCSKELSYESNGTITTPPKDSLLRREVYSDGTDSSVYTFGYDGSEKVIMQTFTDVSQNGTYNEQIRLVRNSSEVITQATIKNDSLAAHGIDSLVYFLNYDQSSSQYTYQLANFTINGFPARDSIAYTYDQSGNVAISEEFLYDGSTYLPQSKYIFSYDGSGNVTDVQFLENDPNSGFYNAVTEDQYQYDQKVSPLKMGFEAYIFNNFPMHSPNNVISDSYIDSSNPANNDVFTLSYTYNIHNEPSFGTLSNQSGGSENILFFYQ